MDSSTEADLPRMDSVEWSIQKPHKRNGDIFLDLKVEFTSKANITLPVLNVGEEFDVDIQHQLVYQIESAQDETGAPSKGDGNSNTGGSVVGSGPYFTANANEPDEGPESTQEETPRKLYKRGMRLSPSPMPKRLFPPSPSSNESPDGKPLSDDDKENKTPEYTESISVTPPRQQYEIMRDTTVVHLPLSPLEGRGKNRTNITANEGFMEPLCPQPPSSVQVAKREMRSPFRPDQQSRIPVATSSPESPDKATSKALNSMPVTRSRIPKKLSLSPEKPRRPMLWDLDKPKSDTAFRHVRRNAYSSNYDPYWETPKAEDGGETEFFEADATEKEIRSSFVHNWLHQRDEQEELDRPSQIGSPGGTILGSPQATKYTISVDGEHQEYQEDEDSMGNIYSPFKSPSFGSISLPSPSTSSKLSMPWNSAEGLTTREKMPQTPLAPGQATGPKGLPVLECTSGTISLTFPEDAMGGVFICDATVHLNVMASSNPMDPKNINIRILTAELNKSFGFKWGMQHALTGKDQDVPNVFLTNPVMDTAERDVRSANKLEGYVHPGELKEPGPDVADKVSQSHKICGQEAQLKLAGELDMYRITRSIVGALSSLYDRICLFYDCWIVAARRLKDSLVDSLGQGLREHNRLGAIKRMLVLLFLLPVILIAVDEHRHWQTSQLPTLADWTPYSPLHSVWLESGNAVNEGLAKLRKGGRAIGKWVCWDQVFPDEILAGSTGVSYKQGIDTLPDDDATQGYSNSEDEHPEGLVGDDDCSPLDEEVAESVGGVSFTELEVLQNENEKIFLPTGSYESNDQDLQPFWDAGSTEDTNEEQTAGLPSLRDRIDRSLGWRVPV